MNKVNGIKVYKSKIRYTYLVAHDQFIGKDMDLMDYNDAGIVKQFPSGEYSLGQKVKVYCNPSKTDEAILKNGIKFKYLWPALCGWLFVSADVFGHIYGR